MYSCLTWAASLLIVWSMVLLWHLLGGNPLLAVNGLAYAGLEIIILAFVSRCAPAWHPSFRRITALLACAIMAGVDIGLSGHRGEVGQKMFFAALLGIALVVLAAKHAPAGLRRRWLGEKADS